MNYVEPGYVRTGYVTQDSDTQGPFRFDGHGRFVFVSRTLPGFDVAEMYSRWKDWARINEIVDDPNAKWPAAMRYSGSDPIPGGFTGATFFMQNGWRVIYDPNGTSVTGVLFSTDLDTALWSYDRTPIFPVTVSAVVNQVTTTQNIVTGDLSSLPSAAQIVAAILAAAQATPIHSDLRKVNDYPITGEGTEATPWGPA
jgi:hypothetical protein